MLSPITNLIRVAALVLIAALLSIPAQAQAAVPDRTPSTPFRVLVVGDSMTFRAQEELRNGKPDWEWHIDAVKGSNVTTLHDRIKAWRNANGQPDLLIIALGTNGDPNWTKQDYVEATWLVYKTVPIVFQTVYRSAADWGQAAHDRMQQYSQWMNQIATDRPNSSAGQWRARVVETPAYVRVDGVHQADQYAENVWATVIFQAVDRINYTANP